ncbi:MAG: hypothetical protein HYZ09_02870, partial [Candidatus Kerfeldbacteria bacterium]|nr:hypothetical protein [Candidatus Kerfeldbacteria bacterium]
NNPYIVPSSFVGTHTWNANATWDNFKFWYGDVETDYALGAEEGYIPPVGGSVPLQPWACNQCGASGSSGNSQCGVGRCITGSPANVNEVCLNNEQCGGTLPDGSDSCQASGRCSDTGEICWTEGVVAGPGVCAQPATCDGLGELVCNECDACSLYGVSIDLNGGGVYGFGYSNDYGFIDFSHAFLYNRSWLQVLRGSIYSRSSVGSTVSGKAPGLTNPASRGYQCNATFVIRSNGTITNFCSVQDPTETPSNDPTVSPFLNPEFTRLDVPSVESGLQSNVDAIRLSELITDVASGVEGANGTNKFGQTIVNINSFDTFSTVRASYGLDCLGNRVFYRQSGTAFLFDEDWTTSTGHGFNNCVAGGRGSFVFEGSDVQIEQNLGYDAASVSPATIAELAALGIIVIPDRANPSDVTLTVALNVIQTVGNFFVDGTIEVVGEPSRTKTDQQYINDGVMVAQSFEFNRRYEGTIDNPQPSEVIRNDGRLTLNPPPGFQGFASNLPQIREYSP